MIQHANNLLLKDNNDIKIFKIMLMPIIFVLIQLKISRKIIGGKYYYKKITTIHFFKYWSVKKYSKNTEVLKKVYYA